MNTLTVFRLDRDRDLTADIVPEAYFRCQAVRELAYPWPGQTVERQLTEIRAAWTDKFLYLHLWAKDSWIVAQETKAKGPVYKDDCLEVFLKPEDARYWGWEINPLGTLLEYKVTGWGSGLVEPKHFDEKWKTSALIKVRKHDAGWVVEMKVPFAKDLGQTPRRGDSWRATFNRIDINRRGQTSLSTFSTLDPESPVWFHQPAAFGRIMFN